MGVRVECQFDFNSGSLGMKLHTNRARHLENSRKTRIAVFSQSLVQALSTQTRIACNLRHSLGTCNVAQRPSNARGIFGRLWSRVELKVGAPLAPEGLSALRLEERVRELSGAAPQSPAAAAYAVEGGPTPPG